MEGWNLKEAVERIRPEEDLKARVLGLPEKRPVRKPGRTLKAAVSVAVAAAAVCGLFFWPQGAPVRKTGAENSPIPAPQTGFAVVVKAATKDGGKQAELVPGRAFQIVNEEAEEEVMGMYDDGKGHQDWEAVFGFQLRCIGREIEKITYETDRGAFQKRVKLNPLQKVEYETFRKFPYSKLIPAPESGYAYAPVGASQEISPPEQSDGILYLRLTMLTKNEPATDDDFKFSTKYQKKMLDGTRIKITAAFRDGTESSKTVTLSYADSVSNGSAPAITAVAE